MRIRAEVATDGAGISEVIRIAFAGAEHRSGTESAIVDALRAAAALAISLVADDGGAIIGHVAFSPVRIDGADLGWFGLGPVAVHPDRQRDGVGRALIDAGLSLLREDGASGCVVLGDPAYYRRFGFVADPALRYADVPATYFQSLLLAGAMPSGIVTYHAGFEAA